MGLAKALFSNGQTGVVCTSDTLGYPTYWTKQLRAGDFIRPISSQKDYSIRTIVNDSSISLDATFMESTINSAFAMTSKYPLYDDDGHTGAKIISSKSDGYMIFANDYINMTIDSSDQTYRFPFSINNGPSIAQLLTSGLNGVSSTYEWVVDPTTSYGYKETLILRTDGTHNKLIIHQDSSGTVEKLGLIPDTTAWGNNNNTDSSSEYNSLSYEFFDLTQELSALTNILQTTNKLDRSTSDATIIYNSCVDESSQILIEMNQINRQIVSLGKLMEETSFLSFADTSVALGRAYNALADCTIAIGQNNQTIISMDATPSYKTTILNIKNGTQYINPVSDTTFIVSENSDYDRRFIYDPLGYTDGNSYYPIAYFSDNTQIVLFALFSGWVGSIPTYSLTNDITGTASSMSNWFVLKKIGTGTYYYSVDRTGITVDNTVFSYVDYPTIGDIKNAVDSTISYVDATGSNVYDTFGAGFITIGSTLINDSTIQPGFRACNIIYQTIDDQFVSDRSAWDTTRLSIISDRTNFLSIRETQILNTIMTEEYLRATDGTTGNIYNWADNRFNRSVGCEAKLKQIEKQIEVNSSSLQVNQRFV